MSFAFIGHQEHRLGRRRCDGAGEAGMRHRSETNRDISMVEAPRAAASAGDASSRLSSVATTASQSDAETA
jgi:hypothetical protein